MHFPTDAAAQFARDRLAGGCDTMRQLLLGLLDGKGRVAEEVHAIRKLGKSLRGGFSLLGLEKSAAGEIQAINRLLAGPRDAASRASTWHKLAWNGDPLVADAITALLDQHTHSAKRRPPPQTMAWCLDRVAAAQQTMADLPTGRLAQHITSGLAKLERRVIKCCRKLDHRAEKNFHKARKAVKAWLGAIGFLPAGMVPPDPRLERLAERLGDENDLATLADWLQSHGLNERFAPDLWQTLQATRHQLQKEVIKEVAHLSFPFPA